MKKKDQQIKYPGIRMSMDGNTAVIMGEREASDAAGAYPITPSTQMGELWAEETAKGHINISGRPLIFIEPEGEHAAASVTAGMSMSGLRATNFSSGQGIVYMHESLYGAVGKRLPYLLNIGCRAITKTTLNVHAGHDDFFAVDDVGFFQVFGKSAQEAVDLNLISRKIAELSLTPGAVGQDGFLTTHLIESVQAPERELVEEFLGKPDDIIDSPTPAQQMLYGKKRRRIPILWDVDNPNMHGAVQNQDGYMQSVAAQRPFFFEHIPAIADQCMDEFYELTGRRYNRITTYRTDDADYLIMGMGSMLVEAESVADYMRESRGIKVGVVNIIMWRPFPGELIGKVVRGRKGVVVLERTDQPLAADLPIMCEVRDSVAKCVENGTIAKKDPVPHPTFPAYSKPQNDVSPMYSGAFGLGSRDLQPEALIGAIENMLPNGKRKRFFYVSIDFIRDEPFTPNEEIHQQNILDIYPHIKDYAIHGSENPNLLPKGTISVRFHSVGGWGAITTGKNLALTLFDLLDYDIKANPKYGSEKKGQPTTYYMAAAPEPIRQNCDLYFVDVVLSPDPNVFLHSNPLAGLKKGGVFVYQTELQKSEEVWAAFPTQAQQFIIDNDIRVYYLDAFKIARDEATDAELQFRMQGIAFQGAFFAASPLMANEGLTEEKLFQAIRDQLQSKFGGKGARVVEDNLRVVRRGFSELTEIIDKRIVEGTFRKHHDMPIMVKQLPVSDDPKTDIHTFWERTGNFYLSGRGGENLADPFNALSLMPASTGLFRDMSLIRFEYPVWVPEKCTACSDCFAICPDTAIPGLVNTLSEVFETTIKRVEKEGKDVKHLRKAVRTLEKKLRDAADTASASNPILNARPLLLDAMGATVAASDLGPAGKEELRQEFDWFKDSMGEFKFSFVGPYFKQKEAKAKGSGGLFSITINPYTCKGCMECVTICNDDALVIEKQTVEALATLRRDWEFWLDLPTTSPDYIRIDDIDEKIGALETMLLDKKINWSVDAGDGACNGCGEKTSVHLFTATVTALLQGRIKRHLEHIDYLVHHLEQHIRLKLADTMDLGNVSAIERAIDEHKDIDLTLSKLSGSLDKNKTGTPLDREWLKWVTNLLEQLKQLKWRYVEGTTKRGRANLGMINATGCTTVYASTFPFNPYPFPWASHLFQDAPSVALGLFSGHMAKMADGFKAVRMAELELQGKESFDKIQEKLTYFDWRGFTEDEYRLCPPVVAVGGDGAMYDIGFQNLSRALMTGMPIKVFIVDTQVYSNTGGQACTSGFISQVADMTPYGPAWRGKEEIRKEITLIGMAHRTTYTVTSAISNYTHLIESYIDGMNTVRPAMWNVYAPCQPEHAIADDVSELQSKLAVESRAYPLAVFDPDAGETWEECLSLEGNPALGEDWPTYKLEYEDENGNKHSMELPMTFADFALTEGRFRKSFRVAPRDTWNENMVPVAEFVDMPVEDREDLFPYVWAVDKQNHLMRVICAEEMVKSVEERRAHWRILEGIAGVLSDGEVDQLDLEQIAQQTRMDMAQKLTAGLLSLAVGGGAGGSLPGALAEIPGPAPAVPAGSGATQSATADGDYQPAWVDSPLCTACDECIEINPKIFAYNDDKLAVVIDPKGGPYKDIVRSAEKCPADCIHPGTPWDKSEKGLDKLIKRAQKYQ
uniref:Pyruvate-ferredoxin/flavodoxin oxidoreductase n=1 Tax=Candidatus Kentrum eta TaxID=2126337 RepID=A0A450UK74_9GAMM|nr:MAG: pyruvate-ferredoxin/flavodoxin oxidoreductase [Candidatus Kentron sp. H]VFJ93762.1 MAG: pyruvate-ferredoxin/flavodoxin oxidoreductase [Candidatus Kentron sp. H]VFK00649.1 MAG: pyruvate-ferredoxin/flavodoxin oxidoreductase [Candidatus Kentron sp. H]